MSYNDAFAMTSACRFRTIKAYVGSGNMPAAMLMRYELFSSLLSFGLVTDGRTESDAYEPTVHKHRCAQKTCSAKFAQCPLPANDCSGYQENLSI